MQWSESVIKRISTEIKYISKGLVIQKQVKNNAGKNERRFGCHLDDIFKFKMIADKLKKKVWLMKHAKSRTEKFCSI